MEILLDHNEVKQCIPEENVSSDEAYVKQEEVQGNYYAVCCKVSWNM